MELWSPVPAWSNVWVRMAEHWEHLSSRLKKEKKEKLVEKKNRASRNLGKARELSRLSWSNWEFALPVHEYVAPSSSRSWPDTDRSPASKKSGLLGRFQYSTHLFLPIPQVVGISGSIRTRSPIHSFMGATLCSHSPPGHQVISQLNPFFHPMIFTLGLTLFDLPWLPS
jgi:hypothetical protein